MTSDVAATGLRAVPEERALAAEFAAFYAEYQGRLIRYCFRLLGDEQTAFDVSQEAFARLFTRWVKIRDPAACLFHAATNLARDEYARRSRQSAARAAPPGEPAGDRHVHLRLAVDRLPRRYREIVLLYYFADLPVAGVARAVRRPDGTVMRQLAEARALLAIDLKDADDAR